MARRKPKRAAANAATSSLTGKLPLPDPVPPPRRKEPDPGTAPKCKETRSSLKRRNPLEELTRMNHSTPLASAMMYNYNRKESAKRLADEGFDPRVATLTPSKYFRMWSSTAAVEGHKPALERPHMGPGGPKTRQVFIAPLVLGADFLIKNIDRLDAVIAAQEAKRAESEAKSKDAESEAPVSDHNTIATELTDYIFAQKDAKLCFPAANVKGLMAGLVVSDVGLPVLESLFATGIHHVQILASTSFRAFAQVQKAVRILDCTGGEFVQKAPHSTIFVAVVPEFTIGDFRRARDQDPCGLYDYNFVRNWHEDEVREEGRLFQDIGLIQRGSPDAPVVGQDSASLIQHIRLTEGFYTARRIVCGHDEEVLKVMVQREGRGVQTLLEQLFLHRGTTEYLHLDKVPFLDRRLLAIILRGCEKITSVSIDQCPLIHVGDLIPILDEIYAINCGREAKDMALIDTLDFGPVYESGMPYDCPDRSANFGITWDGTDNVLAQAGLYSVLHKAFFKARAMGLTNLFDQGCALMRFLRKIPTHPLSIPIFLDACHRIADRLPNTDALEMKKAVFDLLEVVRNDIYTERSDRKEALYFENDMNNDNKTCSSCGYQMKSVFFYPLLHVQAERICFGCQLQSTLDAEKHHLRDKRVNCLNHLVPEHQPRAYNVDAPVAMPSETYFHPLLLRKHFQDYDPTANTAAMGPDGLPVLLRQRPTLTNVKLDSLVGLPTLEELVIKSEWSTQVWKGFHEECRRLDIFRQAGWCLFDQLANGTITRTPQLLATLSYYIPGGPPDHYHERQKLVASSEGRALTHVEAKQRHLDLVDEGRMPKIDDLSVQEIETHEEMNEQKRW